MHDIARPSVAHGEGGNNVGSLSELQNVRDRDDSEDCDRLNNEDLAHFVMVPFA